MKRIEQTPGRCWQACIAMVLGLDLDDVPPFDAEGQTADEQLEATADWLEGRGLGLVVVQVQPGLLSWQSGPFIVCGMSPYAPHHAVAMHDGSMVDPHPQEAMLVSVTSLAFITATFSEVE